MLEDPRLVDEHHPVGVPQRVGDQLLVAHDDRLNRPGAVPNKVLEIAHIDVLRQGDAFNRLARLRAQQAMELGLGRGGLFGAAEGRRKVGMQGCESIHELRDIARGEVADGRRGGGWYTTGRHGDPPWADVVMRPGGYHASPRRAEDASTPP